MKSDDTLIAEAGHLLKFLEDFKLLHVLQFSLITHLYFKNTTTLVVRHRIDDTKPDAPHEFEIAKKLDKKYHNKFIRALIDKMLTLPQNQGFVTICGKRLTSDSIRDIYKQLNKYVSQEDLIVNNNPIWLGQYPSVRVDFAESIRSNDNKTIYYHNPELYHPNLAWHPDVFTRIKSVKVVINEAGTFLDFETAAPLIVPTDYTTYSKPELLQISKKQLTSLPPILPVTTPLKIEPFLAKHVTRVEGV